MINQPKKSRGEILDGMDADAQMAKKEFEEMSSGGELDASTVQSISGWWERWYLKAGHKRLAYILMGK